MGSSAQARSKTKFDNCDDGGHMLKTSVHLQCWYMLDIGFALVAQECLTMKDLSLDGHLPPGFYLCTNTGNQLPTYPASKFGGTQKFE